MKLEIQLAEVQKIINGFYQVKLSLKNTEKNKIRVTNIDSVVLVFKGINDNTIFFYYEVSGLVDLISKVIRFFLVKKLNSIPIKWNAKAKEISIDLKKNHEIAKLLKLLSINDIHIINDTIVLDLTPTELLLNKRLKT